MKQAVIVSTARTGLAKSYRGAFNDTHGAHIAGHAIQHAVARSKVDPALIEDAFIGCGYPEGWTGGNIARQAVVRAGLPVTVAAYIVSRRTSRTSLWVRRAAGHRHGEPCGYTRGRLCRHRGRG